MLTCKVGEEIVNCFDMTYDKHQLKNWSNKNILICPDCGEPYEYCHGRIIPPYFRHKDKNSNCIDIYSEPETKEHIDGKTALYYWLLNIQEKGIIQNLKLESYIPETKQRPDIYFECDCLRYVIEFQCSPIASEYLDRHELYRLANINDIWILGLSKYNISLDQNNHIIHSPYYKTIEQYNDYYLDSENKTLFVKSDVIKPSLPFNKIKLNSYYIFNLNELYFNKAKKRILINDSSLKTLINNDVEENERIIKLEEAGIKLQLDIKTITDILNKKYKDIKGAYNFSFTEGSNFNYYLWSIDFYDNHQFYRFFIKDDKTDYCEEYELSVPFRGKRGGTGWRKETHYNNIDSITYDFINIDDILSFMTKNVDISINDYNIELQRKEKQIEEDKQRYHKYFGDFLDQEIFLINGGKGVDVPKSIRFKFLKGFRIDDNYMLNTFTKELNFLKNINANKYVFMIPNYHSYHNNLGFYGYVRVGDFCDEIIKHFRSYGFTNVKYLDYYNEQ